jgi:hypothetical protein
MKAREPKSGEAPAKQAKISAARIRIERPQPNRDQRHFIGWAKKGKDATCS